MSFSQIVTAACNEYDLTGTLQIPDVKIPQRSDVILHMRALDNFGEIVDLSTFDEIKAEARKRCTTIDPPIFTASLLNGKIVVVDAVNGLFDIVLDHDDTNFAGTAAFQILYNSTTGTGKRITCMSVITFCPTFITSDLIEPEDPIVENFAVYNCPVAVEVGDVVYQTTTADLVDRTDASDGTKIDAIGWVVEKITTTSCKVTNDVGPVPGLGLTPGSRLWLSNVQPGKVVETPPSSPAFEVEIGVAKDTEEWIFTGAKILSP